MIKKIILIAITICCVRFSYAQYGSFDFAKTVPPFKIFDNLYYVGNDAVSAYLVVTDKGLILIDALYANFTNDIPPAVKQLGFDVKDIKYILCTHGHFDHCEGAEIIQKLSKARIGMTEPDWQMAEGSVKAEYTSVHPNMKRDWVIHDGDSLVLGKTTLHFFETPGHTPGVLSIAFPVRDGNKVYNAFMLGGVGLNFEGVPRTEMYLKSIDRIMAMKGIDVNISNHPAPGKIFEHAKLLAQRKPGELHPFVAPEQFQTWMVELKGAALKKLDDEKKKLGK
ncbi:MAG: MBL fold metallo-hydrolase [Bacteroidota bacterium]